ncbi:MAG: hypothetical protein AAFO06_08685 [Cyanobacteria bacterium J06597_16]
MENIDPLTSERITRIHVTPDSSVDSIEAALSAKTGTVVLINDQGIQITLTPSDRMSWEKRFSQPSKVESPDK